MLMESEEEDMSMNMKPEEPKGTENVQMKWASDAIAALLRDLDLPFIALNPGASFRGLLGNGPETTV